MLLSQMDINDLRMMLDLHQAWLETYGRVGARFDVSGQSIGEFDLRRIKAERYHLYAQQLTALRGVLEKFKLGSGTYRQEQHRLQQEIARINLMRANFSNTQCRNALLGGCNFTEADFSGADLSGAELVGSDFCDAILQGCNLEGANLDRVVNLTCEQLRSARINHETRFANTIRIHWTSESEVECECLLYPGTDLSGKDLRDSDFSFLDLSHANFQDSMLAEVIFRETNITGADFRGAFLHKNVFQWANLSGANFSGTRLLGGTFEGANLEGADFRGAELRIAEGKLSVEQVRSAIIDEKTHLMDHIKHLI